MRAEELSGGRRTEDLEVDELVDVCCAVCALSLSVLVDTATFPVSPGGSSGKLLAFLSRLFGTSWVMSGRTAVV